MRASFVSSRCLSRAVILVFLLALPALATAEAVYHVLAKGETLYSVARSYGITVDAITKANSIADPSRLRPGMKLLIPGAQDAVPSSGTDATSAGAVAAPLAYRVAKGDTLFSIARSYGVSVDALRKANKLTPGSVIKSGDKLELPTGAKAPDPSPSAPVQVTSKPAAGQGASAQSAPAQGSETALREPRPSPLPPYPKRSRPRSRPLIRLSLGLARGRSSTWMERSTASSSRLRRAPPSGP